MRGRVTRTGPVLYRAYPIGVLGLMDDGQGLSRVFLRREDSSAPEEEGETPLTCKRRRSWRSISRGKE